VITAFPVVPDPLLTTPTTPSVFERPAFTTHAGLAELYAARKFSAVPVVESLHNSKFSRPCVNVSNDVAAYTVLGTSCDGFTTPMSNEFVMNGLNALCVSIAHRIPDPIQKPIPRCTPVPAFSFRSTK
jgi:hypothetical protein